MISINAEKLEVAAKAPTKSLSQQNQLRRAKAGAKKMSLGKAQLLKKAGIAK